MISRRRQVARTLRKYPWIMAIAYRLWRLTRFKVTVGAIAVITNSHGEVLLVEHVFHPKHPWGLPGGWVENNEQPTDTVEREIYEELAIKVRARHVLLVEFTDHNHMDIAVWCVPVIDDVDIQLSSELLNFGWYDTSQLPNIRQFHRRAIYHAMSEQNIR